MRTIFLYIALLVIVLSPSFSSAQTNPQYYDYSQNHLPWFTIESDHFMIQFQEGNSRSAKVIVRIAEEIYGPITELYQHEPDEKVSIVLKDREDYSNGAAYFFDNKIDIWLPALDTPLRGTHNWFRNVISHEFTHIIQIQKGMKRTRRFPVSYIQWLSYENVRRPDVLYGFPNGIATLPFVSVNIPAWMAEGTAQYQREGLLYESWDAHRDMILRTRILSDTYFTLDEMGTFSSKTSLERETVYNQGYAFVIYLANRFGEEILREITQALSTKGTYNVAKGIEIATGISGYTVFDDWIAERKEFYTNATNNLQETSSTYIEKDGFFNFFPKMSPDGNHIAYLSNKGRDFSLASLYLKNANGNEEEVAVISDRLFSNEANHADAIKPTITFISTSFSFSPDSKSIAYSVNKRNNLGEDYRDIFIFNLETKKHRRLTQSARIESPIWSPIDNVIVAVQYNKGTQNLIQIDPETGDITQLTTFSNGQTVYTPAWSPDGKSVYFAFAELDHRNIFRYDFDSRDIKPIDTFEDTDSRDPFISPDGKRLYFASNPDGIFNIYTKSLESSDVQKLTSVVGGAFMPFVSGNNDLYFSEYEADGYKLKTALLSNTQSLEIGSYKPAFKVDQINSYKNDSLYSKLNNFDDTDIKAFTEYEHAVLDTGKYNFSLSTFDGEEQLSYRKYTDVYTKFSFFPVLRFDNYSKLNGNNGTLIKKGKIGKLGENLIRDIKPGIYFSSRDVLDKLSLFGGVMLGVGSQPVDGLTDYIKPDHILDLDRDIFLIAEHRGLPFIKKGWSPTISIEFYNMRRNVKDGLAIEEFKCTSCATPDTINVDIAYDIWEVDIFLRTKLNRMSLLEFGYAYTPYKVNTDNFYSNELKGFVTGSSDQYFKGSTFSAAYTVNYYEYTKDADIAPIGLKGYVRYQYQPSKLLEEYDVKDGSLIPVFKSTKNHSSELHLRYGFKLPNNQALQARVRGFAYFNKPNDSFYSDYIGGFMGMRSYPYFALGGEQTAFTSLSYFAPIFRNLAKQTGPFTVDKLYARVFFEAGNTWNSPFDSGSNLKTGIGTELRLATNGYYLFPLKFFVSAAYGFNEFDITLPDDFVTGSKNNTVTYGREFLFHFGLTFDFELL